MQFPVPQFTDVEDKIIGPFTLKQFGIVFAAAVMVFLGYTASGKSLLVLIVLSVIFGLPALGLAFVPFNGRPIYNVLGRIIGFILSEKSMHFHKEVLSLNSNTKLKDAKLKAAINEFPPVAIDPQARIKEVKSLLEKQAGEEKDLAGKIR